MSRSMLDRLLSAARHAILLMTTCVMLAPFVWMLLTAIKPRNEIFSRHLVLWPERLAAVENFTAALTKVPMASYLANGLIVVVMILALQLIVALPCAYALAKIPFRGRNTIFGLVLFCLMIPPQVIAIPQFLVVHSLGLMDSYWAVAFPYVVSAFGIFLMRQYFASIPDEILDAARLDGFSEFGIVFRLMVPLSLPAVAAFAIFSVTSHWNEFFWPQIVLSSADKMTPSLGIAFFRNEEAGSDYGPLMAAATIVIAPLIVAFLFAQRRFVEGITLSGLKG
jgi:multiple sugar transport system permease protein